MRAGQPLRAQVAEIARHLHAAGWVANHDGNVTARDGARFVATPTATSKRLIEQRDLIEVMMPSQRVHIRWRWETILLHQITIQQH